MKRLKIISIAAVMLCSLVLIVPHSSQAASITSLSVNASPDYGGGGSTCARLTADEDISYIDWYVKQTYPADEVDNNWTRIHTSMHPTGTRSVSVGIGSLDGHIKIAEYDIKAEVKFSVASDTSTTTTSVYKPVFDSSGYQETGVYGYSEFDSSLL